MFYICNTPKCPNSGQSSVYVRKGISINHNYFDFKLSPQLFVVNFNLSVATFHPKLISTRLFSDRPLISLFLSMILHSRDTLHHTKFQAK